METHVTNNSIFKFFRRRFPDNSLGGEGMFGGGRREELMSRK